MLDKNMKNIKKCVVKRKGHLEKYDEKKVHASIYAAALNCEHKEEFAEKLAKKIMKKANNWFKKQAKTKDCINSEDIRNYIIKSIKDRDIKLMYKHHLDLS